MFPNPSKDSTWDFGILVLGCTFKFFQIHEETGNWDFLMFLLLDFSIFPNLWKRLKIGGFLNISLDCTSKYFAVLLTVGKLAFSKFSCFYIPLDCEDCLSGRVCVMGWVVDIHY